MAPRSSVIAVLALVSACVDAGPTLDDATRPVEVLEAPPPVALEPAPLVPLPIPAFEAVYVEPLPAPARHAVRARLLPEGAVSLGMVQAVEIEVDVEGGAVGTRELGVAFAAPPGFAWERQVQALERPAGAGVQTVRFTLPVAATFIEDQSLSGTWNVSTLDEGQLQASTTFTLEP